MISKQLQHKIDYSIKVMRKAERLALTMNGDGFWLAFSGGKDSQVLYHLALMAGVKFQAHMNLTSIDPPEVVRFVRKNYPEVITHAPKKSIFEMAKKKHFPPTRRFRWCCAEYKETAGAGYVTLIGVRKAESVKRSKRELIEKIHKNQKKRKQYNFDQFSDYEESIIQCMGDGKEKIVVSPILYWSDSDVWEFLNGYNIEHCELYDKGYTRIGCICCPMSTAMQKRKEIQDYPHVKRNWLKFFKYMRDNFIKDKEKFKSEEDMFDWWISDKSYKKWYCDKYLQTKLDFEENEKRNKI